MFYSFVVVVVYLIYQWVVFVEYNNLWYFNFETTSYYENRENMKWMLKISYKEHNWHKLMDHS